MRGPIIVVSDDVEIFETVEGAERYLEAPDVRSGLIKEMYDRDGRKLQPTVHKGILGAEHIKIEDAHQTADVGRFRDRVVEVLVNSTQTRDIGLRMALGAMRADVMRVDLLRLVEKLPLILGGRVHVCATHCRFTAAGTNSNTVTLMGENELTRGHATAMSKSNTCATPSVPATPTRPPKTARR
jgi:hypothetical protein